jgi:hypothetical protein
MVDFLVVSQPSIYNAIIGSPSLNKMKAIMSIYHLKMKFPTEEGVGEVRGDQGPLESAPLTNSNVGSKKEGEPKGVPAKDLVDVFMGECRVVKVGSQLTSQVRESLVNFLQSSVDVFAWTHEDMPGISLEEILHQLNVDQVVWPMK